MGDFYGYDPNSRLDRWRQKNAAKTNKVALKNTQGSQGKETPISGGPGRLPENVIADAVRRNTELKPGRQGDPKKRNILPPGWRERNEAMEPPPPPSVLEILMGQLNQKYEGPDPKNIDFSSLDKALQTRLSNLGGARTQIRGNFDKSDDAVRGMHAAFENQVRTKDAASYNQISDQQKSNLNANTTQSVGNMEASRAKAVAERQAMLKNLGIQQAGGAVDPGNEALNRSITGVQSRNNINQNLADSQRANNLSYNNTVAQSIGQAGVARRSALQQQLAGLMGKVDMAESEAKAQNQVERQRAMSTVDDSGYDQWNDRQNRMADLFDTLSGQELQREKMGMVEEPKPTGIQAVAANLEQSGVDPGAASAGMAALSQILSEGNYLEGANGPDGNTPYDRANILIQRLKARGVDPMTATQIGTSYSNL